MATNWITKNEVNGGNRGTTKGGAALVVVGGLEVSTGAGIPLGVGKISMGLFGLTTAIADVSQGTQDIGYGWNGDSTTPNSNFIRDSLFGGNDERYGIVSTLVGAVGMYVGFVNYPMLAGTSAGALIPGRETQGNTGVSNTPTNTNQEKDPFRNVRFKKNDIKMVNDAANQVGIDRKEFGNYIHEIKDALGMRADQNFTYQELLELAGELKNLMK